MSRLPNPIAATMTLAFFLGTGLHAVALPVASEGTCDLASAADTDSFLSYWQGLGGEVEPEEEAQAILRLARNGDRSVIEALTSTYGEEEASLVSMTSSSAADAADSGHLELAKELLGQLAFEALDDRAKASYASVLYRLGEVEQANDILGAIEPGTFIDGTVTMHLIAQHGVEDGLSRLRELSGHPLTGVQNALHIYDREGEHETRRALLASPQLADLMGDSSSASFVIPEVEKLFGEEQALALVQAALAEFDRLDPSSREFLLPSFVNLLARQGCSDACLQAAAQPIRAAAVSDPEWTEHWLGALAATGQLDVALARAEDTSELLRPAKEWARGRDQPRYLLPLLAGMSAQERAADVAWDVSLGLWSEDDPAVLAQMVALAGPITDPAPWSGVVGTLTRPSRITEDLRQAAREQLVRSTTPGCFVALEPLPGKPEAEALPADLEAERRRLLAEMDSLSQGAEGGSDVLAEAPASMTPLADAREQRVQMRGVGRCEGLVAVVSFDYSFDNASDPGVVSSFEVSHGCTEDHRAVEWTPRDEVEVSSGLFVLSDTFVVTGHRRDDGTFFVEIENPGFEVTCNEVTYSLCTAVEVEAQP